MRVKMHKRQIVDRGSSNWVQYVLDPPLLGHRIWFPVPAVLWGAAVFGLGWLVARRISFSDSYQGTRAIQAACLGIAWVLGSVFWGLRQLPSLIDHLGKCFVGINYAEFASKWKAHFFSNTWMLLWSGVVFTLGATAVYLGMFQQTPQPTHHIFPPPWYLGDPHPKFALLLIVGCFTSLAAGSGISLFVVNLPFVFALLKLSVAPLPNILLAKLRPMSDFYVAGTLAWFVAVGLTALIFFQNLSDTAIGFLLATSVIGLSAFIVPQVIFHIMVVRSLSQMADSICEASGFWHGDRDQRDVSSKLKELNDAVKANSMWVFDRADMTSLLIPELVTVVVLILKSGIVGQHS
jgi:hypothetical protein